MNKLPFEFLLIREIRLKALIMPEPGKFCWCFSKENEYSIPWDCIRQIGEDIILVDFRDEKRLGGD